MILGCEDCGENLPYVEVSGYSVGDRILEGITFRFYPNRVVKVEVEGSIDGLDKQMWLKKVQQYVINGADDTICPKCHKEAYVEE